MASLQQLCYRTVVSQPFDENTYVVWVEGQTDCVVVDPGFEPDLIVELLEELSLTPVAILNTHGHADHIAGNAAMKERWPQAPLVIGHGDAIKLIDATENLSAKFGFSILSPHADRTVREGEIYTAAGIDWLVREVPGHSSGHVVFIWRSGEAGLVLGGDVLFAGSIGRTDFPDGDQRLLLDGIREKLYTLPDEVEVLPGHGPTTTVGVEKRTNVYVRG